MLAAANQGAYLLQQYDRWLIGLEDRHRAWAPTPGSKTAGWLLGHLIVTGDFGRRLCRQPPLAPKDWRGLFAPGTQPSPDPTTYPPMSALVDAFHTVYTDFVAHAPVTPADALAASNPYEPARESFPSAGEFAEYLLTGHLAYHLGQLSAWRAAAVATDPELRHA